MDGYVENFYWAGATQKLMFFSGNLGWTHAEDYHSYTEHPDFDDSSVLLETGFQNFAYDYIEGFA